MTQLVKFVGFNKMQKQRLMVMLSISSKVTFLQHGTLFEAEGTSVFITIYNLQEIKKYYRLFTEYEVVVYFGRYDFAEDELQADSTEVHIDDAEYIVVPSEAFFNEGHFGSLHRVSRKIRNSDLESFLTDINLPEIVSQTYNCIDCVVTLWAFKEIVKNVGHWVKECKNAHRQAPH